MSNVNYASQVADKRNFTVAQKGKLFTSPSYGENETIPFKEVALAAAVNANATSLTLATGGFDVPLYEGTRLVFATDFAATPNGEGYFVVSEFSQAADTTIAVEKTSVTAASGDEIRIKAYIPVFSLKTWGLDDSANVISENNMSSGLYMKKAVTSIDATANSAGSWIYNDPGLEILEQAKVDAKLVYMEFVFPFLRGARAYEGYASQISLSTDKDGFIQVSNQYAVTGEPIRIPAIAA
jgi:hypothetical protein